jgi:SAM-dependent methyltransferase
MAGDTATLDELLNVFWLRPETALWRELDIRAMEAFEFRSPSLDLGCGDGIFSFIRAGGRFAETFDAFRAMGSLDRFFENVDVFDAFDGSMAPSIRRPPEYGIDCGFDHKQNLLRKSGQLGLYQELKEGDANRKLPFPDSFFRSVFSNIVYWLDDPKVVAGEIARVLQRGGRACLMLPNSTLPGFSFYNQLYMNSRDPQWAFLEKLDRGRFADNIRQARSAAAWEEIFGRAGLKVVQRTAHLSKTIVQIWDIGLRPLFPVLHKMARFVAPEQLPAIKREWVSILRQFAEPLAAMDKQLGQGQELGFHCFILEK